MKLWRTAAALFRRRAPVSGGTVTSFVVRPAPDPGGLTPPTSYRVSWPPGYADDRPIRRRAHTQWLYLVEDFDSRAAALEFLRGCEVRDERVYVIAQSPEGNLGLDLVMIFEEVDGSFVEFAERSPLPAPQVSRENCHRCGYSVIPVGRPPEGTTTITLALDDLETMGAGFRCPSCGALTCARCYRATSSPLGRGLLEKRCLLCEGELGFFHG
ncbi:hypothetical protein [Cryptosporangium sp. NPDC051539]|uniref:hypothetical protein n=1 Tax=Cryptosporangium sp. NPDC051539 TaxID=3363962 RepID=UPI0037BC9B28